MAYLSKQVNGKRTYTEHDRRIKAINAKLQRIYDSLGDTSTTAILMKNVINRELQQRFAFATGDRVKIRNSEVNGSRAYISRTNYDFRSLNDLDLEVALDNIEQALKDNPIKNERQKIVKTLRDAGVQPGMKGLFGKKAPNTYTLGQIQAYNDMYANKEHMVREAMDFFYNLDKLHSAGELTLPNGQDFDFQAEFQEATELAKKQYTHANVARIVQLANRVEQRMVAEGVLVQGTAHTTLHDQTSSSYSGSLWEAWDKIN